MEFLALFASTNIFFSKIVKKNNMSIYEEETFTKPWPLNVWVFGDRGWRESIYTISPTLPFPTASPNFSTLIIDTCLARALTGPAWWREVLLRRSFQLFMASLIQPTLIRSIQMKNTNRNTIQIQIQIQYNTIKIQIKHKHRYKYK